MKFVFTALAALCFSTIAWGQTQSLKFEEARHNLGTLKKSEGAVTHTFVYRNINSEKMAVGIVEIQPLCECITPEYSDEAVKHWEQGEIKVTYDPSKLPAGDFENSMYVITDAFENNYQLFLTGTIIDDVPEDDPSFLTIKDLKVEKGIHYEYQMPLGFDVVFVDSMDRQFRKFAKEVGKLVSKDGKAEVLIEASTSQVASKKYEDKYKLAEERMTEALRILVAVMETEGIDDEKISFITSAFIDGPEVEDEKDEKSNYQNYEYINFKLRKSN